MLKARSGSDGDERFLKHMKNKQKLKKILLIKKLRELQSRKAAPPPGRGIGGWGW